MHPTFPSVTRSVFLAILLPAVSTAPAAVFESPLYNSFQGQSSLAIPDGNPVGVSDTREIVTSEPTIVSVRVTLNLDTSFNGDLYAYLRHGDQLAILLNRPGKSAAEPFGFSDAGLNITLTEAVSGPDLHSYRSSITPNPGEALSGSWLSDGRLRDPDEVLDTDARTATLDVFKGLNPNGSWTLYLADLSSGAPSSLNNWKLEITTVPEPSQVGLGMALLMVGVAVGWKQVKARTGVHRKQIKSLANY